MCKYHSKDTRSKLTNPWATPFVRAIFQVRWSCVNEGIYLDVFILFEGVKVRRAHRNAKDNVPEAKVQFRVTFRVRVAGPGTRVYDPYSTVPRWYRLPGHLPVHTPLITLVKGTPLFLEIERVLVLVVATYGHDVLGFTIRGVAGVTRLWCV